MSTPIGEFLIGIGLGKIDQKPLDDVEKKAKEAAKEAEEAFKEAASKIGESFASVAKAIGAAAAGAAVGIFALVDKTTEAAAAIADVSKKTGIGTDSLQRLAFVAQRGGVELGTLQSGLVKLARNLDEARQGGAEPFRDALERLGLTTADLGKGAEKDLGTLADALNRIPDSAERTALTMEVLGKGGVELGVVLAGGSAEIEEFSKRAEELGLVLDGDAIAAAEQFQDELDDLKNVMGSVARDVGITLMPIVKELVVEFRTWIQANRGLIQTKVEVFMRQLSEIVADLLPLIGKTVDFAMKLTEALGGPAGLAAVLGTTKIGVTALSSAMSLSAGGFSGMAAGAGALGIALVAAGVIIATTQKKIAALHAQTEALRQGVSLAEAKEEGRLATLTYDELVAERRETIAGMQAEGFTSEQIRESGALQRLDRHEREKFNEELAQRKTESNAFVAGQRAQTVRNRKAGGGKRKEVEVEFTAGMLEYDEMHGDELRSLAERYGVSDIGIDAAIKAGAGKLEEGFTVDEARKAARAVIGERAGVDLSKQVSTDPLSQMFGVSGLPDASPADIAQDKAPQVLMATINNTYTITNEFDIDGSGRPDIVADNVVDKFRDLMENDLQKVSKYSKVVFAR